MAALTHYAKVDATSRTSTATTAAELTAYTINWADLTGAGFSAGDDVLFVMQVGLGGNNAAVLNHFNVLAGTTFAGATQFPDGHMEMLAVSTGAVQLHNGFWIQRHTLVVNENLYFDLHATSASTSTTDDFSFIVLRLNDLVENVDFKYAEVAHGIVDSPTSYDTSGASVTIPAASQNWLALASARWLIDTVLTSHLFMALQVDGVDRMEISYIGENVAADHLVGIVDALVSPANGATVRVRHRTNLVNTHDAFSTKVFILRLGVFENHDLFRGTGTTTHSVLDTMQEFAGFPTFPLTTTGDVAFFGQSRHVFSENTKAPYGQLQIANVDVVAGYRRTTARGHSADDKPSVTFALVAPQTAGTLDIDFDIAEDADVTPSYAATQHTAVVFSLQLAAARSSPAVIPVVAALPTPAVLAAAKQTPAVIPIVASLPSPTIAAAAKVEPAVIPIGVTLPTPTIFVQGGPVIVTPAVIAAIAALPTPIVSIDAVVTPAGIALVVTVPNPGVTVPGLVTPATIPIIVALPSAGVTAGAITFWARDPVGFVKIGAGDQPPWN